MKMRLLGLWLLLVFLLAGLPLNAFAALSGNTIWETRASGASDNNGGGFVAASGGTDFSQQNGAKVAVGGGTVTSTITTTVVTFTGGTYTVLAGDLGNTVQFISGTNVTAGFYQINSVSAGLNGTWTLDRTPLTSGTTTNAVANMGGALATLGKLSGAAVSGNRCYVTGSFTSTATNTFAQTAAVQMFRLVGYGAVRGDTGHATLTLSTNTGLTGLNMTGLVVSIEQIDVNCASLGTSTGIVINTFGTIKNCKVSNFTTLGINSVGSLGSITSCEITGGTAAATAGITEASSDNPIAYCFVHDNSCLGISIGQGGLVLSCIIANNTGASSDGILVNGAFGQILNNTIHNNGRHGINFGTATTQGRYCLNNVLTNNGGFGILGSSGTAIEAQSGFDGNAYFGNTSGTRSLMDSTAGIYGVTPYTNVHDVILSVSPYVGPTTGTTANFALNNVAGGGAACRKAGSPSTWIGNTGTTGFPDMGAVQSHSVIRRPIFGF